MNRALPRGDLPSSKPRYGPGHADLQGLCLALADWSAELRLLRASRGLATGGAHLAHVALYRRRLGVGASIGSGAVQARNEAGSRSVIGQA
jgi:hypothetical protein